MAVVDGPHGAAHRGALAAHGGKILFSLKIGRRFRHGVIIQTGGAEIGPVVIEGVPHPAVVNQIGIFFFLALKAGVKIPGHFHRPAHRNIRRQIGADGQRQLVQRNTGGHTGIGHIDSGVDTSVGAPHAGQTDLAACGLADGLLEHLLHGDGVVLVLPAVIGGAKIGQAEGDISLFDLFHGSILVKTNTQAKNTQVTA